MLNTVLSCEGTPVAAIPAEPVVLSDQKEAQTSAPLQMRAVPVFKKKSHEAVAAQLNGLLAS